MVEEDPADLTGLSPMDVAKRYVHFKRIIKDGEASIDDAKRVTNACDAALRDFMAEGQWPEKATVDGTTLYLDSQVWASAAKDEKGKPDHTRLARVLTELGMVEFLPSTVNSQKISAYVREHLDPDVTKSLDDRLQSLDPRLREVLNITEKHQVKPNGL